MVLNGPRLAGQHAPLELRVAVVFPVAECLVGAPAELAVKTIGRELFSGEGQRDTWGELITGFRKAIHPLLGNFFF